MLLSALAAAATACCSRRGFACNVHVHQSLLYELHGCLEQRRDDLDSGVVQHVERGGEGGGGGGGEAGKEAAEGPVRGSEVAEMGSM